MKRYIFTILLLAVTTYTVSAQQTYGHTNFGNLLAMMPETKAADKQLEAYGKQLQADGQKKVTAFESAYEAYFQQRQSGELTPQQMQEREQQLTTQQQAIIAYEQEMNQKVAQRRAELLEPLVNKLKQAIEEVAKAANLTMVFDTSVFNAILFAQNSLDITDKVKTKLGI